MSRDAQTIEHLQRTTFGIEDLGLERSEIDLAMSLMKKRHRGDIHELIRTAAFMGLHRMMAHEVETQRAWAKQSKPDAHRAAA